MTTQQPTDLEDVRLAEHDVRAILERAVQLDSNGLSVHELSAAAREAGISEDALLEAVREVLAAKDGVRAGRGAEDMPASMRSALRTLARIAVSALGGGVLGSLTTGAGGAHVFGILVVLVVTAFRAFHHGEHGSQRDFQIEVASVWGGMIAGMSAAVGYWPVDFIALGTVFWLGSSIVGGAIIGSKYLRRFRRADNGE